MSQALPAADLKINPHGKTSTSRQTYRNSGLATISQAPNVVDEEDSDHSEYHDAIAFEDNTPIELSGTGKTPGSSSSGQMSGANRTSGRTLSSAGLTTSRQDVIVGPSSMPMTRKIEEKPPPSSVSGSSKVPISPSSPDRARLKQLLEALELDPKDEVAFRKPPEKLADGKRKARKREVGITRKEVVAAMHYMHFSKRIEHKTDIEPVMKLFRDNIGADTKKATTEFGRRRPRGVYGISNEYWTDRNLLDEGETDLKAKIWEQGQHLIKSYSREKLFYPRNWIINTVKTTNQRPEDYGRWFYFFDTERFLKIELFEFEVKLPPGCRQLARTYSRYIGKTDEKLAICSITPGLRPLLLQPEKFFRLALHIPTDEAKRTLFRIRRDSPDWQEHIDIEQWFQEARRTREKPEQTRFTIGEPVPEADLQKNVYNTVSTPEKAKQLIRGIFGG